MDRLLLLERARGQHRGEEGARRLLPALGALPRGRHGPFGCPRTV